MKDKEKRNGLEVARRPSQMELAQAMPCQDRAAGFALQYFVAFNEQAEVSRLPQLAATVKELYADFVALSSGQKKPYELTNPAGRLINDALSRYAADTHCDRRRRQIVLHVLGVLSQTVNPLSKDALAQSIITTKDDLQKELARMKEEASKK
jgi:hypothetical protein